MSVTSPGVPLSSLNATERAQYKAALLTSHRIKIGVNVLDPDGTLLGKLDGLISQGQVDVDADADITRTLSLTIQDPGLKFTFDPVGAIYADKQLAATYSVYVTDLGWVDVPVFCGPISRYSRNGHEVTLEAVGKEAFMLPPHPPRISGGINEVQRVDLNGFGGTDSFKITYGGNESGVITRGTNYTKSDIASRIAAIAGYVGTVKVVALGGGALGDGGFKIIGEKTNLTPFSITSTSGCSGTVSTIIQGVNALPAGGRLVDFIKAVAESNGENKFRLGDAGGKRIPKDTDEQGTTISLQEGAWPVLTDLAKANDRHLYYDASGYLTLRPWPTNAVTYVFENMLTEPSVSFDLSIARNTVKVYGPSRKGAVNSTLRATASLPVSHQLSAASLSRGGVPRAMLEVVEVNHYLNDAAAQALAERKLTHLSRGTLDVSFETLPVPHLELYDMVQLKTEVIDTEFILKKFTIPLGASDAMTVGFTRPMRLTRKILRRVF